MKRASPNAVPAQKVVERVSGVAEYRVQVLDRALSILDVLATENQLAPAAISARIGLHKSTVHRLLSVLECNEYFYRDPMSGPYSLGLRLIELGTRASARLDLSVLARPMLDRLTQETGETAHIGILDHGAEENRIRSMGDNFAAVWQSDHCPPTLKKMIFRTAIEEIIVRSDQDKRTLELIIHWKGGAHTQLAMDRPRPPPKPRRPWRPWRSFAACPFATATIRLPLC